MGRRLIGYAVTNANGVATLNYIGQGLGELSITAETGGEMLFHDVGMTSDNTTWGFIGGSTYTDFIRNTTYTELKQKSGATTFAWVKQELSVTDAIIIEFDLKQATQSSTNVSYVSLRDASSNVLLGISRNYQSLNDANWHHYKLVVNGTTVTPFIDGVQKSDLTFTGSFKAIQLEARDGAVIHFKNLFVYRGDGSLLSEIYEVKDCTYIDNYTNYGSTSCAQSTTNGVTTVSTLNNAYAIFVFSRTSSLSSAIYINNEECFEFTIVDVTGTVTVRGDKSDGTAVGLFNSNSNPSYFASGNQIRLKHTGDAMEVYINDTLTKSVALTDNRRLVFRLENGATFSFKDLMTYPV